MAGKRKLPSLGKSSNDVVPKRKHRKVPEPSKVIKAPKPKQESHLIKSKTETKNYSNRPKKPKVKKVRVTYTAYSKKRSKLIKQQKSVERRGFHSDFDFTELPRVSELKRMSQSERAKWTELVERTETKWIRQNSYIKTGSIKITDIDNYKEGYHVTEKKQTYEQFQRREASIRAKKRIAKRREEAQKELEWLEKPTTQEDINKFQYKLAKAEGDTDLSYEDWIANVESGPSIDQMFDNAMDAMQRQNPDLYDWFDNLYQQEKLRIDNDSEMRERMMRAEGAVPEFDIYYVDRYGHTIPVASKLAKMTEILLDRPLSASDQEQLGKIIEKESGWK